MTGTFQEQFAEKLGVSRATLSVVENGHIAIDSSKLLSAARILGCAVGDFFNEEQELAARLCKHLQTHDGKTDLVFINSRGRPYSANKLREKVLHPLLVKLSIPRGGFHAARHGISSSLLADGATPAVVQKQLRHSDPRITLAVYAHVIGNQQRDAVENRSARIEQFAVN